MAEKKHLYNLLSKSPFFYLLSQTLIGRKLPRYLENTVRTLSEKREGKITVIDIGCGVGHHSKVVHKYANYIGFDYNEEYINYAKKKYSRFGEFVCDDVSNLNQYTESHDLMFVIGVLHHLDDSTAKSLLHFVDGCSCDVIILDPTLYGKNILARKIVASDRGLHIRTYEQYLDLFDGVNGFGHYKYNFTNMPYCHLLSLRGDIPTP